MAKTSYFIEGLQGAGKSTLVREFAKKLEDYKVFNEGDYSPVELAWCAYINDSQYELILDKYAEIKEEIEKKTVIEGRHHIVSYTQILTDIPGFHKDLEQYEIYNGNLNREEFEKVILRRFARWNGKGQIFECSIFQNIVENQMLYLKMSDDEIIKFYKKVKDALDKKEYRIIYIDTEDIRANIEVIKTERSDENGNELWFPLMTAYIENSPYGEEYSLQGMEGLLYHLERRKKLEHRIIEEVFKEHSVVVKSKAVKNLDNLFKIMDKKQGQYVYLNMPV